MAFINSSVVIVALLPAAVGGAVVTVGATTGG